MAAAPGPAADLAPALPRIPVPITGEMAAALPGRRARGHGSGPGIGPGFGFGQGFGFRQGLATLALLAGLAGCSSDVAPRSAPVPPPNPALPDSPRPRAQPPRPVVPLSAESLAMREKLQRFEQSLLSQGLMRTDGGGEDTPFDADTLARNFIDIALYDEYVSRSGALVAQKTPSQLRRWEGPIVMGIDFGASVPLAQRGRDEASIAQYAARLGSIAGHPIRIGPINQANYQVLVLNETERRGYARQLQMLLPGIDPGTVQAITDLPESTFCIVFAFSDGQSAVYTRALAVIRGEHPDRMRLSCIHEELAQGLGLANDSPRARPSIFNDDEEFALLTTQDELMLKILYDPRLRPGMTPEEAGPIVYAIAHELLPDR